MQSYKIHTEVVPTNTFILETGHPECTSDSNKCVFLLQRAGEEAGLACDELASEPRETPLGTTETPSWR